MLLIMAWGRHWTTSNCLSLLRFWLFARISFFMCRAWLAAVQLRVVHSLPFSLCVIGTVHRTAVLFMSWLSVWVWDVISFALQFPKSNWKIVAWPISSSCVWAVCVLCPLGLDFWLTLYCWTFPVISHRQLLATRQLSLPHLLLTN